MKITKQRLQEIILEEMNEAGLGAKLAGSASKLAQSFRQSGFGRKLAGASVQQRDLVVRLKGIMEFLGSGDSSSTVPAAVLTKLGYVEQALGMDPAAPAAGDPDEPAPAPPAC